MKKNIILAAFAAASAILLSASCQKQELVEQNNGNASKTFTATIEQGLTKTTITNEYKVNWVEGDQIDINGTTYSATPDASDATKATFTKVSGSDPDGTFGYTAVYPASIMAGTQATLPATQSYAKGRFNAPMYAESETEAFTFQNICGVLCLSLKGTDKVKSIAVTANEEICGSFEFTTAPAFSITEGGKTVTLDCGEEGVQLSTTDSTNFYIYLPPKDSYTAGMKIVVTSTEGKTFEKTTTTAVKIERNNLYTFNWTATFAPAPLPGFQLWEGGPIFAECNVGATKPEDAGYYFWWGDTVGYRHDGEKWVSADGKGTTIEFNDSAPANTFCGKDECVDANGILKSDYDAATAHLGAPWRMMTKAEMDVLVTCPRTAINTQGEEFKNNGDTFAGWRIQGKEDYSSNSIFLPATGYGDGSDLNSSASRYLTATPSSANNQNVQSILLNSNTISSSSCKRYNGVSVRAVRDAAAPLPAGALAGEFTVAEGKKVHFSQGNLWYGKVGDAQTATFQFEANQYDVQSSWSTSHVSHFYWSKSAEVAYAETYSESGTAGTDVFFINATTETAKSDFTVNGVTGKYRTLSTAEWQYLFNTRTMTNGKDRYSNAVSGVTIGGSTYKGVFLYPDNYNGETVSSSMTWNDINAAGIVFLPAAGSRDGSDVDSVGGCGDYWSSTAHDENGAYDVYFDSEDVYPVNDDRYYGFSVRLITEVK